MLHFKIKGGIRMVILLLFLHAYQAQLLAQDVIFTQWENMPIYFNPSLTGNFKGNIRLRTKYRDQWRALLGKNAFNTSAASFEYKFNEGSKRKLSLGMHALLDNAGQSLSTNSYNLSTSISQNLGDTKDAHHNISLGFNLGVVTKKLDLEWSPGTEPEDFKSKISYPDFSSGINWQYISQNRFQFQLGSGIAHLNKPNVSFFETGTVRPDLRYTIHGVAEVPIMAKISLAPSFLYFKQGFFDQLLFGLAGKFYFKANEFDFLQLGLLAKTTQNFDGRDVNVFVLSTMVELNGILLGYSFDRFQSTESNAHEFSLGYVFGR